MGVVPVAGKPSRLKSWLRDLSGFDTMKLKRQAGRVDVPIVGRH